MKRLKRRSGVLLHISSLPSPFGIGVMGSEAREFAKLLARGGFSVWQILPVDPVGEGNSPYSSDSAFGGNTLFIDPRGLAEDGYISQYDVDMCVYKGTPYTADYGFAIRTHNDILRLAYSNAGRKIQSELKKFAGTYPEISVYALYLSLKDKNEGRAWYTWGRYSRYEDIKDEESLYDDSYLYYLFCQYIFHRQYTSFKKDVNALGVDVFGDMPIYVSLDSADVWAHTTQFDIDQETYEPYEVAGVPPDYFCEDGQLWGNPLYNWKNASDTDFVWHRNRVRASLERFDIFRIDHFRGFASYWAVPKDALSAKEGIWRKAKGRELFDRVKEDFPDASIVAEDLGVFGEDVVELLKHTCFPGMRVIQFGFGDPESDHLPHNYSENTVAFAGTHDNNTLLGWLYEASEKDRSFALDYCGFKGSDWGRGGYEAPACRAIEETLLRSRAALVILPYVDLCGFGSDARMNIPGLPKDNWRIRTTKETMDGIDIAYYKRLNSIFGRLV